MCITREILKWIDKEDKKLEYKEFEDPHWMAKVVGLSLLEGAIDGCVLVGAFYTIFGSFVGNTNKNTK